MILEIRKILKQEIKRLKEAIQKTLNSKRKQPQPVLIPYRNKKIFS